MRQILARLTLSCPTTMIPRLLPLFAILLGCPVKILACLKQVPDANSRLAPDADGQWIETDGLAMTANEFDLFGLELALKLKDADGDIEIVVVTIGDDGCKQDVRKALARGADRAVLLSDPAFAGGDPWSNSATLAAVAEKEGPFDIVVTGLQAWDDNFGQTGPLLAERLGTSCATGIMSMQVDGDALVVERELEGDAREVVKMSLPALVSVQTGAGDGPPRYPNIKGIMAAKKKPMTQPTPDELGVSADAVGAAGRRLEVVSLKEPEKTEGAEMLTGSNEEIAAELVRRIRERTGVL
ncbi:MAG: electron transfer flavoprotein subunit beta/FixA family protein [Acidobacteriota bacterium]